MLEKSILILHEQCQGEGFTALANRRSAYTTYTKMIKKPERYKELT
jgi:hypothetical protein